MAENSRLSRSFGGGIYAHERATWSRFAVELGGRLDHLSRTAFLQERFYENHMRRGTVTDEMCTYDDDLARCPSSFNAASVSVGALWDVVPQTVEFKLDLSSASRAPNADEAYMLSSAPTFPIYVYSDPSLDIETTWGASPTIGLDTSWLQAELSGFANRIDDYIHFAPELDADGEPNFDVTIRGAFPRYSFRAIQARFHGFDGSFLFAPYSVVSLRVQGSVVRAIDLETQQFLVGTPPDRGVAARVSTEARNVSTSMRVGSEGPLNVGSTRGVNFIKGRRGGSPTRSRTPPRPTFVVSRRPVCTWGSTHDVLVVRTSSRILYC